MKFIRLISLIFLFQIINIGVNAQLRTNFLQYGSVDLRNEKYLEAITEKPNDISDLRETLTQLRISMDVIGKKIDNIENILENVPE